MTRLKKPVYNYNIDECNKLFKLGIPPIGIGTNDKTQSIYVVFRANKRYFEALKTIQNHHSGNNDKILSSTL